MESTVIASTSERIAASLIDGLIFLPLFFLDRRVEAGVESQWILFVYFAITWQLGWMYSTLLHGYRGQTLGKMRRRIQVVRFADGGPVSYLRAAMRDLPYIILVVVSTGVWVYINVAWFCGWYSEQDEAMADKVFEVVRQMSISWALIECVSMMFHPQRRSIHDVIAGTIVIRQPRIA